MISEAVSPGFAYEDMGFVSKLDIESRDPALTEKLNRFVLKKQ